MAALELTLSVGDSTHELHCVKPRVLSLIEQYLEIDCWAVPDDVRPCAGEDSDRLGVPVSSGHEAVVHRTSATLAIRACPHSRMLSKAIAQFLS